MGNQLLSCLPAPIIQLAVAMTYMYSNLYKSRGPTPSLLPQGIFQLVDHDWNSFLNIAKG